MPCKHPFCNCECKGYCQAEELYPEVSIVEFAKPVDNKRGDITEAITYEEINNGL